MFLLRHHPQYITMVPVKGRMVDAGFYYGDSNYHAIIQASDGNVYYVICSHNKDAGARMFRYNPHTDKVTMIGDLTDVVGEDRKKGINQGKVHSDFYEVDGKLYFATHAGLHDETYPGGHFMCYDLRKGTFEDLGIGVQNNGNVAMSMDVKRGRMYAITWPGHLFAYYDINTKVKKVWGKAYAPFGQQVARSIAIDPRTGNVYWPNYDSTVECYTYATDMVANLKKPKFDVGIFQVPLEPSYFWTWRSIRWSEAMQKFYGIMYTSEWMFSFEPMTGELEVIDRIASGPNRKSGNTAYSSLAFELSRDGGTIYYIPMNRIDQPDTTKKEDELHLVTYDISQRRYTDDGAIVLDDGRKPRYCQGFEVGTDGNLYIVGWIPVTDKTSEKWKKLHDIATGGKPSLAIEQGTTYQEINLVVMKDPLRK